MGEWDHYQKLVLTELTRLDSENRKLQEYQRTIIEQQTRILIEISALKVKASIWGFMGGAIAATLPIALTFLKH